MGNTTRSGGSSKTENGRGGMVSTSEKGSFSVSISQKTMAKEYTSTFSVKFLPRRTSGAIHRGCIKTVKRNRKGKYNVDKKDKRESYGSGSETFITKGLLALEVRETKVANLYCKIFIDEQVTGLQVTVNNWLQMRNKIRGEERKRKRMGRRTGLEQ